jgi:2-dehydro-3-deoxyglucarate aldolase/4-hydroxy-2-oxoheptanedioate aldolase
MRDNPVKRTLAAGGTAFGTMVFEFKTDGIGRIVAEAGAEFVVYDMEHTGWSTETVRGLIATTPARDIVPMVRVPATEYHLLARVLDVGALGLMVPMVESEDQARAIVRFAKYPPRGRRGAAFGVAHDDFTAGDVVAKMENANREGLLIAQIETVAGLQACEAIAAVEGIDVLWIGHFDLTASLGIPAQFDHPDFLAAVARVVAACDRAGKAAGIMAGDVSTGHRWLAAGFRAIAYSGDHWIYGTALREGLASLRAAGTS